MRSVIALTLLSLLAIASAAFPTTKYAVFRLDDIQDYWLEQQQMDVMNVFKDQQIPLSFGIVAHDFDTGSTLINYIKSYITDAKTKGYGFEVANHGWVHEYFSKQTLAQQTSLLKQAKTRTLASLSGYIDHLTTFIPPYNDWNANTLTALKSNGFTAISADTSSYLKAEGANADRPIPGTDSTLREWPIGVSAGSDLSDSYPVDVAYTMNLVNRQMSETGYASIMLHFYNYAMDPNAANPVTNQSAINDLKTVIANLKAQGFVFTTYEQLSSLWFSGSTTPTPAPATTGVKATTAAPATTGVKAPATTGVATTGVATTGVATCDGSQVMQCVSSSAFRQCDNGVWQSTVSCPSKTSCAQNGKYVYCACNQ